MYIFEAYWARPPRWKTCRHDVLLISMESPNHPKTPQGKFDKFL